MTVHVLAEQVLASLAVVAAYRKSQSSARCTAAVIEMDNSPVTAKFQGIRGDAVTDLEAFDIVGHGWL